MIFYSGSRMSKYGDAIASATGMTRSWVGLVLLATATSIPELVSAGSAAAVYRLPNIATGNLLGSCLFNLLLVAILDAWLRRKSFFARLHPGHVRAVRYAILMFIWVGLSILFAARLPVLGHLSVATLVLLGGYLFFMHRLFVSDTPTEHTLTPPTDTIKESLRPLALRFSAHSAAVLVAALFLPKAAANLADSFGLTRSFVGTTFLAATTVLPEVVVTFSAMRIGAPDLAMGNLLGSNLFNLGLVGVTDALYLPGALLAAVSSSHIFTVVGGVFMLLIVEWGIRRPPERPFPRNVHSWLLFAIHAMVLVGLYFAGEGFSLVAS